MCGIVGVVSQRNVIPILLDGLSRLEYRGYDSAGLAIINASQQLQRIRRAGKVNILKEALIETPENGTIGIAHTRWATHGAPCERNAHPHLAGDSIAIVHNGIIENYNTLKAQLQDPSQLSSDTDTEVVAAMIHEARATEPNLLLAVKGVLEKLVGTFALAVLDRQHPDKLILTRVGSPLVIGLGINEYFVASDPLALHKVSHEFVYLKDYDIAELSAEGYRIYDQNHRPVVRDVHTNALNHESVDKGPYRHYMLKEIMEQPIAIANTLSGRLHNGQLSELIYGPDAPKVFPEVKHVMLIGCGTSYYAALIAKFWFEGLAGIPCHAEIASEFRYRKRIVPPNTLMVAISQSGETADTLAALRDTVNDPKGTYLSLLGICNVPESSLVRDAQMALLTHAGPEIGVASTKAFTTQLSALYMLMLSLGRYHNLAKDTAASLGAQLQQLPPLVEEFLALAPQIAELAALFKDKTKALFLGRGLHYAVALEGALKLKEISYIHAEAYPAGELKHGPLALVDDDLPIVVIAPNDELIDKLKSNIQEVLARGGRVIALTPHSSNLPAQKNLSVLAVPETPAWLSPILYTIPLQLLAYHVAILKGTDVDQPRNLAKSVTVE